MTITKKTRLLPAPFVGTRITIKLDDPESLDWGIYRLTLLGGVDSTLINWGDGTSERVQSVQSLTHAYPSMGTYEVTIPDECTDIVLASLTKSSPFYAVYPPAVRSVISNATNFKRVSIGAFGNTANMEVCDLKAAPIEIIAVASFYNCPVITHLDFPKVTSIASKSFAQCPALTEIHFGKANEAIISALSGYGDAFGAENAKISFDL